ncbi:hypothetical protein F53441_12310 [Fusarium austroafricanum]|uniref:Protein kinase domain-containing protein n=1 Tax=Fusarium austroafricanum TaxID=2364996 RepID=A0A8H4JWM7_9HYPO|nr:hypothetical protein F53441_12310 [Fusarium austroafricanum]
MEESRKSPSPPPGQSQFQALKILDHAPATSHGTYLASGCKEDMESLEEYQEGGYHPVHLGDLLGPSGRYQVIHKLGHGGFGTVWLCRNSLNASYVALKIMVSELYRGEILDFHLAELDQSVPGAQYIATPLDHFYIEGPNGVHQCLVFPPLGPQVSPDLWMRLVTDPAAALRKFAHQTTQALDFLHKNQICHGGKPNSSDDDDNLQQLTYILQDFRPSNILLKLAQFDHLSEDELLSRIGQPMKNQIKMESEEELPASCPKYLVPPADICQIGTEFLADEICVIDFGESFKFSSPPEDLGIPEHYLPPEVLLECPDSVGPACDLWALGCTLFEIREQIPLFYMIPDTHELLAEMVTFFGKFPEDWWAKWEAREDWFDNDGKPLREPKEEWSLEVALSKPTEVLGPKRTLVTPEAEQKLIADLLYQLFRYDSQKRISAEEVLGHEWFKF